MDAEVRIQKVKLAMLAMQRRAWEQGAAAQALLELGEGDLVILMAKDAVVNQAKDGLFHDILNQPNTFVETNAAQMFSYTIYRGVKEGWLDASYRLQADRMREAVYRRVDEFGLVQGVCGAPHFDHPGTATEGQAFFLLMEAAYRDLLT